MNHIRDAIDRVGGAELARRLRCSKQLVSHWRTGRQRIPAERAIEVEAVSEGAIRRDELRPDLWPVQRPQPTNLNRRATDTPQPEQAA